MATTDRNRTQYLGETKQYLRDGHGVYNYPNGFFRYEGEWKKGKKEGHGKLLMKDGSYYEGQFQNGEIEGNGFRYFALNENKYTGQFHQGELQGDGIMHYGDGAVYEGEWHRNKKQGFGKMIYKDSSVYEGNFHNQLRHGEGVQTYINEDFYDGDWIHDKRQGHGRLKCQNGTIYEGQWHNDMFNGQGTIVHSSGIVYEGLWINGMPSVMATKVVIDAETMVIPINQGEGFSIKVECRNSDDELVSDQGRELRISAGFRYQPPKEGSALFDVIEDVEESPIPTPFGYDIVTYPLTDQVTFSSKGQSDTEISIREDTELTTEDGDDKETVQSHEQDPQSNQDSASQVDTATDQSTTDQTKMAASAEQPPAVPTRKTEDGLCSWSELYLPPPPPMYRPFMHQEEDQAAVVKKKSGKVSKDRKASQAEGEIKGMAGRLSNQKPKLAKEPSFTSVTDLEELYTRPGEYVVMVQDVTNPPFMGMTLEPAFILLEVKIEVKKTSREGSFVKKEKGPRWDTSRHIAQAMVSREISE